MQPQTKRESGQLKATSIDPVCGMTAGPESAGGSYDYKGQTYYFCGARCRERFQTSPESFLNKTTKAAMRPTAIQHKPRSTAATPAQIYTCPMHPEIRQDKAGSCPKCGMALEPVTVVPPKEKIEYTCPMHPQIVRDSPGNCPICGMALEPRTVSLAEEENHELKDNSHDDETGIPRWLYVPGIIAIVVIVLFVILHFSFGGRMDHGMQQP